MIKEVKGIIKCCFCGEDIEICRGILLKAIMTGRSEEKTKNLKRRKNGYENVGYVFDAERAGKGDG
jgi:hypothetical protein